MELLSAPDTEALAFIMVVVPILIGLITIPLRALVMVILPVVAVPAVAAAVWVVVVTLIVPVNAPGTTAVTVTSSPLAVALNSGVEAYALIAVAMLVANVLRWVALVVSVMVNAGAGVVGMILTPSTLISDTVSATGDAAGVLAGDCALILIFPVANVPKDTPLHLA